MRVALEHDHGGDGKDARQQQVDAGEYQQGPRRRDRQQIGEHMIEARIKENDGNETQEQGQQAEHGREYDAQNRHFHAGKPDPQLEVRQPVEGAKDISELG
jgi:hypothetical protein